MQYYFNQSLSDGTGGFVCNIFYPPVESYLVSCSAPGAVNASTFYDMDCDGPSDQTSDEVPANPSTNPTNGTCNSARVFNGNQEQFTGDVLGEVIANVTLPYCSKVCKHTRRCKSFFVSISSCRQVPRQALTSLSSTLKIRWDISYLSMVRNRSMFQGLPASSSRSRSKSIRSSELKEDTGISTTSIVLFSAESENGGIIHGRSESTRLA